MLSKESWQLINGMLGSRRDQEAGNVKKALKSEGYKLGNQTMIEYVEEKRRSVRMTQTAINELKAAAKTYDEMQEQFKEDWKGSGIWLKAELRENGCVIDTSEVAIDGLLQMWASVAWFILNDEDADLKVRLMKTMRSMLDYIEKEIGGAEDDGDAVPQGG